MVQCNNRSLYPLAVNRENNNNCNNEYVVAFRTEIGFIMFENWL